MKKIKLVTLGFCAAAFLCGCATQEQLDKLEQVEKQAEVNAVNYVKEKCSRFTFDCKMYDTILDKIDNDSLRQVALIDSNAHTVFRECSRNDIKEAFDFYTNR